SSSGSGSATAPPPSATEGGDGLAEGDEAVGVVDVEVLHHAPVVGDDALALGDGRLEGRDQRPGVLDGFGGGGPHPVGRLDLAGVDERLAVEAELAALDALGLEAGLVLDVVV